MAYVNVSEWKAESVAEWLQGLDDSVVCYAHFFLNNNVTGKGLLNLTVDDLVKLNVTKIGHQEIILEALDLLRNLHHNLDTENLQYVCLRLSCKARSLCNELRMYGPPPDQLRQLVSTSTMVSVGDLIDTLWIALTWLDREPFATQETFTEFKSQLQKIGIELATNTARGSFAEKPIDVIKDCCDRLANLADSLIRDCSDPMILQPATLDVSTMKKRPDETDFGIHFDPTYLPGMHVISRDVAVRHQTGRIDPGDEVIQVNYQTVVGWEHKNVLRLMEEHPSELILTLKKRPKHSNYGQIYMKPFRIPARHKREHSYFNNLPSPRAELLVAPKIDLPKPKPVSSPSSSLDDLADLTDLDSEDDETFLPTTNSRLKTERGSPTQSIRSVLLSRPRSAPQRRATISGSSPTQYLPYMNVSEFWSHCKGSSEASSNNSTIKSNDSGMSTMSGEPSMNVTSSSSSSAASKKKLPPPPPRSPTVNLLPTYTNLPSNSRILSRREDKRKSLSSNSNQASSLDSGYSQPSSIDSTKDVPKQPIPKPRPRTQLSSSTSLNIPSSSSGVFVKPETPGKKRPIPQPRKLSMRLSTTAMTTATTNPPSKSFVPVPTASFKSYRRYPPRKETPPGYVNTSPSNRLPSSTTPVTRLTKPSSSFPSSSSSSSSSPSSSSSSSPAASPPTASTTTTEDLQSKKSPYYVSDVYRDNSGTKSAEKNQSELHPDQLSQQVHLQMTFSTFGPRAGKQTGVPASSTKPIPPGLPELPPPFSPATYTLEDINKQQQNHRK